MENYDAGVYTARKKDNSIYYRASLTYRGKHISLGSYDTKKAANSCYLLARQILESYDSHVEDYPPHCAIPYDK